MITDEAEIFKSELAALRRDFHEHPELGFKEFRTSKVIYDYLRAIGADDLRNIAKTGIAGTVRGRVDNGRTVVLRANMDALPVQEKTELPFASENAGVMHAVGHDAQMAVALVVAKILSRNHNSFNGNIRFVFQPNEEVAGALEMINGGVLDDPPVNAALGMNFTYMLPEGDIGLSEGRVLGTTEEFVIRLTGRSVNTAWPHYGIDAAIGAAKVLEALQTLESRKYDPMYPISITVGKINGGTARNIMVGEIVMEGTIRFLFPREEEALDEIKTDVESLVDGVCSFMGMQYDIEFIHSNSSLVNSRKLVEVLKSSARMVNIDYDKMRHFTSLMGEDFAEFAKRIPSVMTFFGIYNKEADCIYPNANAKYNLRDDVLVEATKYYAMGLVQCLNFL
ncbi:MAG: amidohydrolase [Eubacteriales bacterium]|nr:amidohydrolase [Eubacteriales bacterium]